MTGLLIGIVRRDLALILRHRADWVASLFFFIIVASLFPFGVGSDMALLRKMAAGILWVAALLSTLLCLPRLFADDLRDGSLEQIVLSPHPLGLIVFAKVIAHWLTSGLPLTLLAPLLGLQLGLPTDALALLTLTLLLGTPALSGIGAIGAALTLGLRGGGVLISLLILPLYIPTLIFGAGAVKAVMAEMPSAPHLSLLAAMTLLSLFFAPWAAAAALRVSLE